MKQIIYFGYDINKIIDKHFLIYETKDLEILRYVLDNGLNLNFVDQNLLEALFDSNKVQIIKILCDYGLNINILNSVNIPNSFSETYQFLVDVGIDPKNIF